jgi:hypothetical protein
LLSAAKRMQAGIFVGDGLSAGALLPVGTQCMDGTKIVALAAR